jgi:hypothetical protein
MALSRIQRAARYLKKKREPGGSGTLKRGAGREDNVILGENDISGPFLIRKYRIQVSYNRGHL